MYKKFWFKNLKGRVYRPGHRLEDNIEMDLKGIRCEDVTRFIWLKAGSSGVLVTMTFNFSVP
jgi:hypothetical protein